MRCFFLRGRGVFRTKLYTGAAQDEALQRGRKAELGIRNLHHAPPGTENWQANCLALWHADFRIIIQRYSVSVPPDYTCVIVGPEPLLTFDHRRPRSFASRRTRLFAIRYHDDRRTEIKPRDARRCAATTARDKLIQRVWAPSSSGNAADGRLNPRRCPSCVRAST